MASPGRNELSHPVWGDFMFSLLFCIHHCFCIRNLMRLASYTPLAILITWLNFGGILLETFFLIILFFLFFLQNFTCVFLRSNTLGHFWGMVGPLDVKLKGCKWVGHWVNYVTLTFDLTMTLILNFYMLIFRRDVLWYGAVHPAVWAFVHPYGC